MLLYCCHIAQHCKLTSTRSQLSFKCIPGIRRHPAQPVSVPIPTASYSSRDVCAVFTLNRPFYPASSVNPVSFLIPYPINREIVPILWSQNTIIVMLVCETEENQKRKIIVKQVKYVPGTESTATRARLCDLKITAQRACCYAVRRADHACNVVSYWIRQAPIHMVYI